LQWHNNSLNLTEPAVHDFNAARRRRLARYRYASLAAGEDCIKENE
jgi:hypothetical protein